LSYENDFVLDVLIGAGLIDDSQGQQARDHAEAENVDVKEALQKLDLCTEEQILASLALEMGMETFDLYEYRIPQNIIDTVDRTICLKYKVIPVMEHDGMLTIAISDPTDLEIQDTLRYVLKTDIEPVVCSTAQIVKAIDEHYGTVEESVDGFLQGLDDGTDLQLGAAATQGPEEEEENDNSPIIRLVSLILVGAYRTGASDIHLEPMEKRFRVRYRIDGVLQEMDSPPKYLQNNIISRLKIMARLDISEKRVPQDGRITFKMPKKVIDLRVSTVPTVHGESIVMRILDKSSIQLGIPELGFFNDDQELIGRILGLPDGIFLVTGPTGSGKTTSLYAFLNTLNTPNRKIITAEDPCEYDLPGINQVQCDNSIGMTFPRALRAMLRQAPNIVMVGEIRDIETGAVAINAALTGHLVFSTLHTNDAPSAVSRLIDMGVKPFLVASGVRAIMAQRLVRRNCKNCSTPTKPTREECALLSIEADYFDNADLRKGAGCGECNKGFKGRMGIYEILYVEEELVTLIFRSAPSSEIRTKARELGMRTLRDDAMRKAGTNVTTLEEVIRITKNDEEEEED
jgi:type IV pilus assembly protein PilB